ncbi:uncharacterized protein [Fopius arisanus]|uniref:Uncharacterized protein isoform X2 n=2 Tax=Fopius arisanus TaxID=64838 RepID=A0A9R1UBR1_9HYME|nr:PREDICTED: uncharacterized protein LOC105273805 isoform X2 [Fopius arisanus]
MISSIISRLVILVFGTLYPAYASYKAVRTKNVKEYVKWMMYWIVFALFTCAETFTDVFFSFWFPFYYEIKIILVLWLLSPATKGSSILYRRFVHPALIRREAEIDDALARATEQGYTAVLHLGTKGVNYATTVLMQTAIKGGGGLVQQLKKSYSLSDLTGEKEDENRNTSAMHDETDMTGEPRRREHPGRRGYSPRRTQSNCNRVEMYFSEVDVDVRQPRPRDPIASLTNIRSSDDISSGYSSGEALQPHRMTPHTESLMRTSSVGARTRSSKPRAAAKKVPEDEEDWELTARAEPPHTLSEISAKQALELLFLLSRINLPHSSSEARVTEIHEDSTDTKSEDAFSDASSSMGHVMIHEEILDICELDSEGTDTSANSEKPLALPESTSGVPELLEKTAKELSRIDMTKITEEICQEKMSELKRLLSTAQSAVSSLGNSHEDLTKESRLQELETEIPEVWTTPSPSRSGSEGKDRAGKYHKKPAPRAPVTIHGPEGIQALRATLVLQPDHQLCDPPPEQKDIHEEEGAMRHEQPLH